MTINLGELQEELETATEALKNAVHQKQKWDQAYEEAVNNQVTAQKALNMAVSTIKASNHVPDIYAA